MMVQEDSTWYFGCHEQKERKTQLRVQVGHVGQNECPIYEGRRVLVKKR